MGRVGLMDWWMGGWVGRMRRISGIRESYQPFPPIASLNPTTDGA